MATVLIIYYKQISEGYEDKERFAILKKIGMERGEINASIHSQVLMVFFLPLAAAGIHSCFAFHLVKEILMGGFGLWDVKLPGSQCSPYVPGICRILCDRVSDHRQRIL